MKPKQKEENTKHINTGDVVFIAGRRLRKIGERHGELAKEEHKPERKIFKKPKKRIPKPKVPDHKKPFRDKQVLLELHKEELKKKITPAEKYFRGGMNKFKIDYQFQKGLIAGDQFMIADFYVPKLHMIVEIDGGYHETYKQQLRDDFKDKYYNERHFNVLRIKNEEVFTFDYSELAKSIAQKKLTPYMEVRVKKPDTTFEDISSHWKKINDKIKNKKPAIKSKKK